MYAGFMLFGSDEDMEDEDYDVESARAFEYGDEDERDGVGSLPPYDPQDGYAACVRPDEVEESEEAPQSYEEVVRGSRRV